MSQDPLGSTTLGDSMAEGTMDLDVAKFIKNLLMTAEFPVRGQHMQEMAALVARSIEQVDAACGATETEDEKDPQPEKAPQPVKATKPRRSSNA